MSESLAEQTMIEREGNVFSSQVKNVIKEDDMTFMGIFGGFVEAAYKNNMRRGVRTITPLV